MKEFTAGKTEKISKSVADNIGLPFNTTQKLLRKKDIKVNGKRVKEDLTISEGDIITVYFDDKKANFKIIFQDENILVINKPPFITSDDLFERLNEDKELYYIHRLDRNTDGIIIFAKTKTAETALLNGFKERTFSKYYKALVYGKMPKTSDIISAYLVKDSLNSEVKIFDKPAPNSEKIITGYTVIEENIDSSLLSIELFTGKTHQIRAHLAHIGHFVLGDGKYGDERINKSFGLNRQQLTAVKLILRFDEKSQLYYLNNKEFTI